MCERTARHPRAEPGHRGFHAAVGAAGLKLEASGIVGERAGRFPAGAVERRGRSARGSGVAGLIHDDAGDGGPPRAGAIEAR